MILEECSKCPKHYSYRDSLTDPLPATPPKRHKLNFQATGSTNTSVFMKNRRIQTTMVGGGGVGGVGVGSSQADRLDFRGAKFEIIQKDIGYSSDADMSDACEAHQCADYINLSTRGARKRTVRRRRSRISRRRPWSFHSDWTDWDYYQPPFCYSAEYKSSEDVNSYDDESVVRNLIEFGENYEFWIKNDDDVIMRASTPTHLELVSKHEEGSAKVRQEKVNASVEAAIEEEEMEAAREEEKSRSKALHKSRSSRGFSATSYLVYFALSIFVLAITALWSCFPPHVQKTYPQRPPPI